MFGSTVDPDHQRTMAKVLVGLGCTGAAVGALAYVLGPALDLGIDGWSLVGVGLVVAVVGGHQWVESRLRQDADGDSEHETA